MTTAAPRALAGANSLVAARLLVILDVLGHEPNGTESLMFPDVSKVVRSSSRLAKLDFWLRNPDYLADELLNDIVAGELDPANALAEVDRMLSGTAPTVHSFPMQRYKHGAWELPDNALALLKSAGCVDSRRVGDSKALNAAKARRDYFLLAAGVTRLNELRRDVSQMGWYDQQAAAIKMLSVGGSGAAIRARQYEQPEYKTARVGTTIGSILKRTHVRFVNVAAAHGYVPRDGQPNEQGNG